MNALPLEASGSDERKGDQKMHWQYQFDAIVRPYYQEVQKHEPLAHEETPSTGAFRSISQDADGTSYQVHLERGDLLPTLRIIVPGTRASTPPAIFRVQLTPHAQLTERFTRMLHVQGSAAFQELYLAWHASLAVVLGDLMKLLFWKGNLDDFQFPSEITVVQEHS
jgi:hypothetical protein